VVIEAMACGRPVIGSRDGGIPEIIEEGKTGRLIELVIATALHRPPSVSSLTGTSGRA